MTFTLNLSGILAGIGAVLLATGVLPFTPVAVAVLVFLAAA